MNQTNRPAASSRKIAEQVILPWPVAVRITLRGLKIRFGRSLITMSGVVLGIAFLMSVLTGEGLKSGLAEETRTKTEVTRLVKLVEDEIGSFGARRIGVILSGPLADQRFARMLTEVAARVDRGAIAVFTTRETAFEPAPQPIEAALLAGPAFTPVQSLDAVFRESHVVLLLSEKLPSMSDEAVLGNLGSMVQPVLLDCFPGRFDEARLRSTDERTVYSSLSYQLSEEEVERAAARRRQARARQIWITIVSILVTVIGISNAMLMSVTERIREIGTMKCLGALSGFVVKLFLIESFLIGVVGAVVGTILGFVVPFVAYMLSAGVRLLLASTPVAALSGAGVLSVAIGTFLAIVAAIYPAVVAAKMVPADALRTNV